MITIIEPPAPAPADALPELAEIRIFFCFRDVCTIYKEVKVYGESASVVAPFNTIGAPWITITVPKGKRVIVLVGPNDKLPDHMYETLLVKG